MENIKEIQLFFAIISAITIFIQQKYIKILNQKIKDRDDLIKKIEISINR